MILPAALLVFVFAIFPMLQGLYASFFQIEAATLDMQFNGLENYHWLVTQSLFWKSLLRSIYWVVGTTVAQVVLGVSISLLLHQELKGRNIARGMVLFPYLMPAVVIALTWRFMLDPTMGVFNRMLMDLGMIQRPVAFLANRRTADSATRCLPGQPPNGAPVRDHRRCLEVYPLHRYDVPGSSSGDSHRVGGSSAD
jgi:multiple sugar transport system permease protein